MSDAVAPLAAQQLYIDLFCARADDYASWAGWGWPRASAQLTSGVVARGLDGGPSISGYMVGADGLTHVLALDVDTEDGTDQAQATARWMWSVGVPAYVEPSRNGRAHLWVSLDARVAASVGRRFLTVALWNAGVDPDDKRIERFPKQDAAPGPGAVGSCLRLPMMPNPKNGVRYPLLDPDTMKPLGATLQDVVAAIQVAPAQRVIELAGPEPEPVEVFERSTPLEIREFNEQHPVSEVLEELWDMPQAEPGRSVRCPAHDDLHPSLSIFRDDRRVLCWAPACPLNNDGRGRDAFDLMVLAPSPQALR
jgi:hypothetical protein